MGILKMGDAEKKQEERMEFRRIGGSCQPMIRNAGDLRRLLELDEAHWALNSVGIAALQGDPQFYRFLDEDGNGQIRSDEVKRAVGWFLSRLKEFSGFERQSDVLELDAIDDSTPAGMELRDAARLVLANLGCGNDKELSLEQIRNDRQIVACALRNGDGVIPPEAAETPETTGLAAAVIRYAGSVKDVSGADGANEAMLDQFLAAATAFLEWTDAPAKDPALLLPFGSDTVAGYARFTALEKELDNYFLACGIRRFRPRAAGESAKTETAVDPFDPQAVHDFFTTAPVAEPRPDGTLDFAGKLNPLKAEPLSGFPELAWAHEFFQKETVLTAAEWKRLKERFAPYAEWLASKPNSIFDGCDPEQLQRWTSEEAVGALRKMIAADLAAAPRIEACERLHKLILFQRYLRGFLNNFVNLSCLFNPGEPSPLQAGKLVMDGRCFTLVSIVANPAEHKSVVQLSDICVIYLDAASGKAGAAPPLKLAAAITSGNIRNFFPNKHGLFFSADGEVRDAKITEIIRQPVSVSEALRMPFYKCGEFIGNQAGRLFSEKSAATQKQLATDFNAAASGKAAELRPAVASGPMLLMGGGIGLAALGSAIAFIVKSLANISIWNILAVLAGIVLVFGGPVVAISLVKLYRRNLSRFLEANGCAVNRPMRLTRRMGAIFSFVPPVPKSNYLHRDPGNRFRKSRSRKA